MIETVSLFFFHVQGKGFEPAFTSTTRIVNDCIPGENGEWGMHSGTILITK
jgi:hypothetical protein